jgi:alpha-ketoglutarate-dependent 2,4-dichlorophenoxyacetate dioxygenase
MSLKIQPILPRFGAELSGVDITRPLDEATRSAILDAQNTWGVTVWRQTGLDDETHIAFSRIFGHVELAPALAGRPARHKHREIFDASNLDAHGNINQDEMIRLHKLGDRLWHTDSSYMPLRSAQSLLLCHEAPALGGATWFADTRSAYEALPQATRQRIDHLTVRHSLWWSRRSAGYPLSEEEVDQKPHAEQPLVHVHKGSGRKALYLAAHARDIVELLREEGRALLRELIEFATKPQFVFSITYRRGDLVIWDNLCSMHRGGGYDERHHRRDMRRTTIREAPPPAQPDDPFTQMFVSSGTMAFNQNGQRR